MSNLRGLLQTSRDSEIIFTVGASLIRVRKSRITQNQELFQGEYNQSNLKGGNLYGGRSIVYLVLGWLFLFLSYYKSAQAIQ